MSSNIHYMTYGVPTLSAVGIATVILISSIFCLVFRKEKTRFPPGPRGLPVIGAAFLMPNSREWITYDAWRCQYGEIVGVKVFNQSIVLLNSSKMVKKLLDGRSVIYSNRPTFPMLDMMGLTSWNVGLMPLNSMHKTCRALYAKSFGETSLDRYNDIRLNQIFNFLRSLRESCDDIHLKCRSLNVGIVMRCFYGLDMEEQEAADLVALNNELHEATSLAGSPAAYLVNTFPVLRYWPSFLPGSGFKAQAKTGRDLSNHTIDKIQQLFYDKGYTQSEAFLSEHMYTGDKDKSAAALAGAATAYSAAVETSTSLLLSFIIAMVLYPDAQKKAQDEIDLLEYLPSLDDRNSGKLPYVEAILLECYRWGPPGAFGLPHFLKTEDTIGEYKLPPNTIVMPNIWSILYDCDTYPEPDAFLPDRFLPGKSQPDPREHVFGYGRRICPGRYFAEASLWLEIVFLLRWFKIVPYTNCNGETEMPTVDFTSGVMRHPVEFKCKMIPRSKFSEEFEEHI
ncbi:cytochrome P450 [Cyathus striatus]|nr:cytochrome P450 [Cyathus striatus]